MSGKEWERINGEHNNNNKHWLVCSEIFNNNTKPLLFEF